MPSPSLSDEHLERYARDGFTVVPGLIGTEDLDRWDRRFDDIVLGRVAPAERMLVMKDVMVAKGKVDPADPLERIQKIQDFEHDEVLDSYCQHPAILECVERIVGPGVMTVHNMLINKPPNVDGRHPLHQDLLYFPFRPADRIVASWTAMTRMTKENGCLVVVPGSHRGELLAHDNPDWENLNGGYFGVKDLGDRIDDRLHLEMEPGDTVFFHPVLLHGSGRNRTDGFRRAISAHYANADCEWTWSVPSLENRLFRIVSGPLAGQVWDGVRTVADEAVDPVELIPEDNPLESMRLARAGRRPAEGD